MGHVCFFFGSMGHGFSGDIFLLLLLTSVLLSCLVEV